MPASLPRYSAGRSAGDIRSPRSVSFCRSRSNARPSASVPEKAIATQRIPDAAPSTATPSRTKLNENTSMTDTAKKSVV